MTEGPFYVTRDGVMYTRQQWLEMQVSQSASYHYRRRQESWPGAEDLRVMAARERGFWFILIVILLLLCWMATGCAARGGPKGEGGAAPRVKRPSIDLQAHPQTAFGATWVTFDAWLRSSEGHEEPLWCAQEAWRWGDPLQDEPSLHSGDCAPYEAGDAPQRHYRGVHYYGQPGDYRVTFELRDARGRVLVSGQTLVRVL